MKAPSGKDAKPKAHIKEVNWFLQRRKGKKACEKKIEQNGNQHGKLHAGMRKEKEWEKKPGV